jgi:hypothetical protein
MKNNIFTRLKRLALFGFSLPCIATAALAGGAAPQEGSPLEGRWDITVVVDGKPSPSWLEVMHSGNGHLVGQYVGIVGSARPISKISFADGKMSFTIPPQWEKEMNDLTFEATLQADSLLGTMVAADGKTYNWSGHRAPLLKPSAHPTWGSPITLLKANSLDGWHALGENQWTVESGVLKSPHSGSNLVTDRTFTDFKLHIEFRCPKESNSGVYLRGRYEVQIEDSKGKEPQKDLLGAIYGFLTPNEMVAKTADEWQTYDITLVGRLVTVVANGKEIICRQTIPGITGGALDSQEEQPGPLLLQGDHRPIEFRNIVITPSK